MLPSCQTWRCPWRPETLDGRGARDMRTGKNMGIMTTFKKPTLERALRGGRRGEACGAAPREEPMGAANPAHRPLHHPAAAAGCPSGARARLSFHDPRQASGCHDTLHLPLSSYSYPSITWIALPKADCRGSKYVEETIKMLPEKPEPVLLAKILNQVTSLGRIHLSQPSFSFS